MSHNSMRDRALSVMLAAALVFSLLSAPVSAVGAGTELHRSTVNISDSLGFVNKVSRNSSGRQESCFFEYIPGGDVDVVLWYGEHLVNTATIDGAAEQLAADGYYVLGGINGDFYSSYGIPLGALISDGRLISTGDDACAVAFSADGSAEIVRPSFTFSLENHGGGESEGNTSNDGYTVSADYLNKLRTPYGLYLYSSDYANDNMAKVKGCDVLLKIESGELKASSVLELTVEDVRIGSSPVSIPEGYLLLSGSEYCAKCDQLSHFSIGDSVTLTVSCDSESVINAENLIGCEDIIIENGEITDPSGWDSSVTGINPRTAIGIKADGTVLFYTVDGRKSSHSIGLSMKELAEELLSEGCVSAVNLDGGGSTSLLFRCPQNPSPTIVNTPSGGAARSCTEYIFLVSKVSGDGAARSLYLSPANPVVLAGSVVSFDGLYARDNGYRSCTVPDDAEISASGGSFDIENLSFTAPDSAAVVSLELSSGSAHGVSSVTVVDAVDSISVTRSDDDTAVSSLELNPAQSVQLSIVASALGVEVISDFSDYNINVVGDIGGFTSDGIFTASSVRGAEGTIEVSYGDKSVTIPVSIRIDRARLIENFEGDDNIFSDCGNNMSVTSLPSEVFRGRSAGALSYELSDGREYFALAEPISFETAPQYIRLAAKGAGEELYLALEGSNGELYVHDLCSLDNEYGWYTDEIGLTGSCKLLGFILTGSGTGRVFIDQIIIPQDESYDVTPPAVTLNLENGRLKATLSDDSKISFENRLLRLTVDGKETAFNLSSDALTAEVELSSASAHHVSLAVSDASGNLSRACLTLSGTDSTPAFDDVDCGHWAFEYVQSLSRSGVIKGSGNGCFSPSNPVTRAEFCTMLSRWLGLDTSVYSDTPLPFADCESIPDWAVEHIKAVYALGYINGKVSADGSLIFDSNSSITRAELFTLIGRMTDSGYCAKPDFTDAADISPWALNGVIAVVGMGLVNGYEDGSIRCGSTATRAEVAKLLFNLY